MARKKYNPDEIDEEFIISTIQNDKPEAGKTKEKRPTTVVKRKPINQAYDELFLSDSKTKARFGKNVPIRQEYHKRIQQIIRVIGKDEISIYNYIDNVLTHHFDEFQEEIVKRYNENNEGIF
ncbi:DUF3408 domain-containing protein [uncultured Draconibacterium sp.]|uniref:DUF3408 domain-containing protein n=1 Tax=uncultured Draconibacterium sp. TaxID=1573823 RepID=UPI003217F943